MSLGHLRPLSFGEILDGAFVLYRRHFAVFFTTALIPLLPVALLWGAFGLVTGGTLEMGNAATAVAFAVAYPVMIVGMLLMWGALVHEAGQAAEGRPIDRAEAYRVAFRRMLPMLGAAILFTLLAAVGFLLLVVPAFLVMIALFGVWQAVILEEKGPVEAIRRSRELARGAWGRIFGIEVVSYIIVMIPGMLVGTVTGIAMFGALMASGDPEAASGAVGWFSAVNNVLSLLLSALTTPFMVAALTLLYYDRRVRTEALDLELATERLGATV
ncbi:MAG TPA: hypothetical protein VHG51_14615 [Longimicrobiaceae bacterium]|nr:hypothetical protein [Longimicrobiaceae bacterium]